MIRLILMRHAKSDWSNGGLGDHDRPLNGRGRKSAPAMGEALVERGFVPDVVRSSDSARTTETWERMGLAGTPQWTRRLYLADPKAILDIAAALPTGAGCALLLGHNPGMSEAVSLLAGRDIELRTADAAVFEADGDDWQVARDPSAWRLIEVLRSRDEA